VESDRGAQGAGADVLPSGTVTLVFSDIEGSTRMLQRLRGAFPALLADHHRLVDHAVRGAGGRVLGTEGDGVFAVFVRAGDAVRAAAEAQRALAAHSWPEGEQVRIRMGLHTGEPVLSGPHYVGLDVHRAARICSAAHGGQVLLSKVTTGLVEDDLPEGVSLRDLGAATLKDLEREERLSQLVIGGLPADFPPPRTASPLRPRVFVSVPQETRSLVGREREIDEVLSMLSESRVVTVTGPGGSGKTKLAIRVGHRSAAEDATRSVLFVGLAPLQKIDQVPGAIARSLNREGLIDTWDDVYGAFAEQRLLILLDNAEHLRDDIVERVDVLTGSCPHVTLLVTSRAAIRVPGEREYPLAPLPIDEATTLLIERMRERKPRYEPRDANERNVLSRIAARLDGLPLAVELAAARLRVLTPLALLERLDAQLDLLATSDTAIDPRQRSMRATITWSYRLLGEDDGSLFRSFGVFPGSAGLGAIAAVSQVDEVGVLDRLESLVDASLVRLSEAASEPRYWMLEPIRQYAVEQLSELGETGETLDRLAAWVLTRVRGLQRCGGDEMRAALRDEVDTVMRVIAFLAECGRWDEAVELMLRPLHGVFDQLGLLGQLEPWIVRATTELRNPSAETRVRLVILGQWIAQIEDEKTALLEEAFAVATVEQLDELQAEALRLLAEIYVSRQDARGLAHVLALAAEYPAARLDDNGVFIAADLSLRIVRDGWDEKVAEEAISAANDVGSEAALFSLLNSAAWIALQAGDADWAFRHAEQAVQVASRMRLPRLEPVVAHTAALAALATNRLQEARNLIMRSLELLTVVPAPSQSDEFERDALLLGAAAVLAAHGDREGASTVLSGINVTQLAAYSQVSGYGVCHPFIREIRPHPTASGDAARVALLHLERLKDAAGALADC
jgi:predicted ATPase/class 3 adenylate cyclase